MLTVHNQFAEDDKMAATEEIEMRSLRRDYKHIK